MNNCKNIFLVEDDKDDQFFFTKAISQIKNATLCFVANNGREALDQLESSVTLPDIIFMDINMPMMNGIECLKEIVRSIKMQSIPVVIFTTDAGSMKLALQIGAKGFIEKQADGNMLRQEIEQAINYDFIGGNQIADQTFQQQLTPVN